MDRAATLGTGRLLCIDGPAGSGKTTLAEALRREMAEAPGGLSARVVHMDDLYAGWAGLEAGMHTLATRVVAPLRAGRPGRYRRFDWHRGAFAEECLVEPVDVLVVEGVGAGTTACAAAVTCLVWVSAPPAVRLSRGLARDGEAMRPQWLAWQRQEAEMFARERTQERADVVVDGTAGYGWTVSE
jgi:uridine kinase